MALSRCAEPSWSFGPCNAGTRLLIRFLPRTIRTMDARARRCFNSWNLVGLILLPAVYWGLDALWHVFFSNSRLLLLANLVIPIVLVLAAYLCWAAWGIKLSGCASPSLSTLLGIYLTGPTYLTLGDAISNGHMLSRSQELISSWASMTFMFPI